MTAHLSGRDVEWLGTAYRILLSSEETGSRIAAFESLCPPGSGPPRHVHHCEDETFLVQSGEVEFRTRSRTAIEGPGSIVFVPRGTEHAFRVLSELPARMLTIMTPGGFEGFFAEMAAKNYRIPEDMDEIVAIAERFNLAFTGLPLHDPSTTRNRA